jgi:hypothetical protein
VPPDPSLPLFSEARLSLADYERWPVKEVLKNPMPIMDLEDF